MSIIDRLEEIVANDALAMDRYGDTLKDAAAVIRLLAAEVRYWRGPAWKDKYASMNAPAKATDANPHARELLK